LWHWKREGYTGCCNGKERKYMAWWRFWGMDIEGPKVKCQAEIEIPHDEADNVKQVHLIGMGISILRTDFLCEKLKGFHDGKF
jgi:hypothetical protein